MTRRDAIATTAILAILAAAAYAVAWDIASRGDNWMRRAVENLLPRQRAGGRRQKGQ